MAKVPIALQLYSVRGECQNDLPATLAKVGEIGYAGAEPWGYGGEAIEWMGYGPADLRRLFDDAGLACCGMHLQTGALLGDNLARTIELNQALGNRFLIIAADKARMESRETILELAGILNEVAAALAPLDLYTGYHAHPFDFAVVDGEVAWNILFSHTDPGVIQQMDLGNCAAGGGDPYAALERFPGTARTVHVKDHGGGPEAVIGEGLADWERFFRLCDTLHPVEWYVVEEGHEGGLGFDIPARSLAALRAMGR